jgi:hypothetical protein
MRAASGTALSGQPGSRAESFLPLDPTSRELERDADASLTADREYAFTSHLTPIPTAPKPNTAPEPQ